MPLALRVENDVVVGLPDGTVTLFLAKLTPGYYAVFGPRNTCFPKVGESFVDIPHATFAIFDGAGVVSALHPVQHGRKYAFSGGMAEISRHQPNRAITWTTRREAGRMEVFGQPIRLENVLIAL